MTTWDKDDEITYQFTGRHFDVKLPPRWKEIHIRATWESSGDWALYRRFTPEDFPGVAFKSRYLPLGVAGGYGGLIKWLSLNNIYLSVSDGDGRGVNGNFAWFIRAIV